MCDAVGLGRVERDDAGLDEQQAFLVLRDAGLVVLDGADALAALGVDLQQFLVELDVSARGLGLPAPVPDEVFDGEWAVAVQPGSDFLIEILALGHAGRLRGTLGRSQQRGRRRLQDIGEHGQVVHIDPALPVLDLADRGVRNGAARASDAVGEFAQVEADALACLFEVHRDMRVRVPWWISPLSLFHVRTIQRDT